MKTKETNPRNYKRNGMQYAYILDSIDVEDYEMNAETDREKIDAFFQMYNAEYNDAYNRRMYPNECERLAQYLQGLPSSISCAFTYHDIAETLKTWGVAATPRNINNWFNMYAARLLQLRKIFTEANE